LGGVKNEGKVKCPKSFKPWHSEKYKIKIRGIKVGRDGRT